MRGFEEMWESSLADGVLRLPKCTSCSSWNWYPLPVCSTCKQKEFAWVDLEPRGKIHSWTRVHRNFTGHDVGELPYLVALVEPDGAAGVRIPCRFQGDQQRDPEVGQVVALEPCLSEQAKCWSYS